MSENILSLYTIEFVTSNGQLIAEFAPDIVTADITLERNKTYNAKLTFDLDKFEEYCRDAGRTASSILGTGENEVRIRRGTVYLMGGQVGRLDGNLKDKKQLMVYVVGFLDLLAQRVTGSAEAYSEDAGLIAWDAINASQIKTNGDFGIRKGTIQTSITRTLTYEYKSLKDVITELADIDNGFDFEFTYDKKFNVFYPSMGNKKTEYELTYPGNIKTIKISDDSAQLANEVLVRGQGYSKGQTLVTVDDSPSQLAFKLRQKILDKPDLVDNATLTAAGNELLRANKAVFESIILTMDGKQDPQIGTYGLGDQVHVVVENIKTFPIDNYYKVDKINITIDDKATETVELTLSLV